MECCAELFLPEDRVQVLDFGGSHPVCMGDIKSGEVISIRTISIPPRGTHAPLCLENMCLHAICSCICLENVPGCGLLYGSCGKFKTANSARHESCAHCRKVLKEQQEHETSLSAKAGPEVIINLKVRGFLGTTLHVAIDVC